MKVFTQYFLKPIVYLLTILYIAFQLTVALPPVFGYEPKVVLSGSMEPEIPTGSMVYVDTHNRTPKVNDVVTYTVPPIAGSDEEVQVTHRVVGIDMEKNQYLMKGDANDYTDGYIDASQIHGVVRFDVPYLGFIYPKVQKVSLVILAWLLFANVVVIVLSHITDRNSDNSDSDDSEDANHSDEKQEANA